MIDSGQPRITTVIADDEPLARRLLCSLVEEIPILDLVAQCRNGREAVAAARDLEPDLLILDVQMPGLTGFDVVKELQSDTMPMIVFCTAYQRYAIDAFDLHAVDYLLKPVSAQRLQRAVDRVLQRRSEEEGVEFKSPVLGAIDEIARRVAGRTDARQSNNSAPSNDGVDRKIAIRDQDSTLLVEPDEIDWIDAAGDYMCLHVQGETLIMRSTLTGLMSKLDPDRFKRIHRSTVVNLERIVKATPLQKGEYMLELDCGETLKVSRNFRQAIKVFLSDR